MLDEKGGQLQEEGDCTKPKEVFIGVVSRGRGMLLAEGDCFKRNVIASAERWSHQGRGLQYFASYNNTWISLQHPSCILW